MQKDRYFWQNFDNRKATAEECFVVHLGYSWAEPVAVEYKGDQVD